ncbi:MAG: TolC family protein [Saprospiraceae bacterium]|nr:TolC family protein [Saprospiraceae bacterium]
MRILTILIALITAGTLPAQTLDDYLTIALENNPGIKAQNTEYQAARQKIDQAGALPDPQVNASVFIRPMMLPMGNQLGSISAMQMFPWFGALHAMKNEAAQMAEVKQQAVQTTQNELAFQVKSAWYPLLELEVQGQILQEKKRVLEIDKELASIKFQHGQAPMADAIRADIMIDEVVTQITLLEEKRRPLEAAFNLLLNRPASTPVAITATLPEIVPSAVVQSNSSIVNNPALAVFDKQIQAEMAAEQSASYLRKPTFSAGFQYMPLIKRKGHDVHIEPNTGRDMVMPMVSITIPIWRKKYNAAVEERRLMQQVYSDMKNNMENELSAMAEMTGYELEKLAKTADLLDLQQKKTQQLIDLLMAAYSNNGKDFEEILRLQQQLFRYQSEKATTQTQYQLALAKLEFLTGKIR